MAKSKLRRETREGPVSLGRLKAIPKSKRHWPSLQTTGYESGPEDASRVRETNQEGTD